MGFWTRTSSCSGCADFHAARSGSLKRSPRRRARSASYCERRTLVGWDASATAGVSSSAVSILTAGSTGAGALGVKGVLVQVSNVFPEEDVLKGRMTREGHTFPPEPHFLHLWVWMKMIIVSSHSSSTASLPWINICSIPSSPRLRWQVRRWLVHSWLMASFQVLISDRQRT